MFALMGLEYWLGGGGVPVLGLGVYGVDGVVCIVVVVEGVPAGVVFTRGLSRGLSRSRSIFPPPQTVDLVDQADDGVDHIPSSIYH